MAVETDGAMHVKVTSAPAASARAALTSTPVAAGTGDVQGLPATPNLRLVGVSITEAAAAPAAAEVALRHGTLATSPLLHRQTLGADGTAVYMFGEDGLAAANGIFVDRMVGTTELVLFTRVEA